MDIETFRLYCLSKAGTDESLPFGPDTLVFKVMGKMFALTSFDAPFTVNLKCDPDRALELREYHAEIVPGYHMNKKHWNTLVLDGSIPEGELERLIDHSYTLVVAGLKKGDRLRLKLNSATTI